MFCLQCALSCVGRHCLSAAELQRAFLPFQGADLKQLTPGFRTLWQDFFFFNSTDLFSWKSGTWNTSKKSPALPRGTVFCWVPSISDRNKHQSLHSASPRALCTAAWQGTGVCQGGAAFNGFKHPGHMSKITTAKHLWSPRCFVSPVFVEPCLQGGTRAGRGEIRRKSNYCQ